MIHVNPLEILVVRPEPTVVVFDVIYIFTHTHVRARARTHTHTHTRMNNI